MRAAKTASTAAIVIREPTSTRMMLEYQWATLSKPRLKPSASARPNRARKKRGGAAAAWCGFNSSGANGGGSGRELYAQVPADPATGTGHWQGECPAMSRVKGFVAHNA